FATLVRATRADFAGEVKLKIDDLPPGVTVTAEPVAANLDLVPVLFEAAADAPTGGKLCAVAADAVDPKVQFKSEFTQTADLVVYGNQVPYYQVKVRKLAVAVAEEAPFKLKIVQPKVPLVQTGAMQLKVVAERKEGFKAPISLAMLFNPPGVGSGGAIIAESATETAIPLNASGDAQVRKWKVCVIGSSDSGGPLWVSSQMAELEIAPPFLAGKIEMAAAEQGKPAQVLCSLEQKAPFEGKAQVQLLGLPPNTSAAPKEITAKDAKIVFDVQTDAKSPTGQHNSLFCSVTVTKDGEPIAQSIAPGGVLRIDAPPPAPTTAPAVVAAAPPPTTAPAVPLSRLEKLRQDQLQRAKQGANP
ncbi:MAG: peptidase, partial [Tepidisphaeraceae bacterium]